MNVEQNWHNKGDQRGRHAHITLSSIRVGCNQSFQSPTSARLNYPVDKMLGAFLGRPGELPVHGCLLSHLEVAMSVSVGQQDPGYSPGLIGRAVKVFIDASSNARSGH